MICKYYSSELRQAHEYIMYVVNLNDISYEVADKINNIHIKYRDYLTNEDMKRCQEILKKFQKEG